MKPTSTGRMSAPSIGIMSWGQADSATMQSISARSATRSPARETVGSQSMGGERIRGGLSAAALGRYDGDPCLAKA